MVGSNDLPREVDNAENDGSSLLVALDGRRGPHGSDDFSSVSAKETMHYVARAWDRMADDLEGRLSKSETEQMIDERTEGRRG